MESVQTYIGKEIEYYNGSPRANSQKVRLLDTTLREGEQSPGVSFSVRQRLQIAWMLDYFGVDAIEISPVVSKGHEEACREMLRTGLKAEIVAHGRALRDDVDLCIKCGAKWVAMYHSVSDLHLEHKLKITREKALERISDAVSYAKSFGVKVRITMEDASRTEPDFLVKACEIAAEAEADRISLPDTVGVLRPAGMHRLVRTVKEAVDTPIDLHCHNDLGMALANALAGIEAGADQIHVTINGLGERVGIVSLAEAAVALTLLYGMKLDVRLEMLKELSDLVQTYTGERTSPSKPLVGENAYRHKAGTHLAAMIRDSRAYELFPPEVVGNRRRLVFGELTGRNGASYLMKILGLKPDEENATRLAEGLKSLRIGDLFEFSVNRDLHPEALRVRKEV